MKAQKREQRPTSQMRRRPPAETSLTHTASVVEETGIVERLDTLEAEVLQLRKAIGRWRWDPSWPPPGWRYATGPGFGYWQAWDPKARRWLATEASGEPRPA